MSTVVFGIKNCDTVKKALRWLDSNNIAYDFSDFRDNPPSAEKIRNWIDTLGLDTLINKRSTTYRQLEAQDKNSTDTDHWVRLIDSQPTLIKRPLLSHNELLQVSFNEAKYKDIFNV